MTMPNNLVFVRHGQSEANVIQAASKLGDDSLFNDEVSRTADRQWRLTEYGVMQARTTGEWLREQMSFDRFITSPYTRTRETAGNLDIPGALWEENRVVRERSWGEISSISRANFAESYPHNAMFRSNDALYWAPPAGESIAGVAENRVRNLLSGLRRESAKDNVLVVTHGEFMWASRLTLESWSDEEFIANDKNPSMKIHNCSAIHYTRINPFDRSDSASDKLNWVRMCYPFYDEVNLSWGMHVGKWRRFDQNKISNEDLLSKVALNKSRLPLESRSFSEV